MRYLLLLLLAPNLVAADVGIDLLATTGGFGFESGFGIQFDGDGQYGMFGWDLQASWTNEQKIGGDSGHRQHVQGTARFYMDPVFLEAGVDHGRYSTKFADGRTWEKAGTSPLIGVGAYFGGMEVTLRYAFPDNTVNRLHGLYFGMEVPWQSFTFGLVARIAEFEQSGSTQNDAAVMLELGWRLSR